MSTQLNRRRVARTVGALTGAAMLGHAAPTLARDATSTPSDGMGDAPMMAGTPGMGGEMLGGSAQTETLADAMVEDLPDEPLVWAGYVAALDEPLTHEHSLSFVYAKDEPHTVTIDGEEIMLQPGEGVFMGQDVEHTHAVGSFWETLLTTPEAPPPPGLADAEQLFISETLEGVPQPPVRIAFIRVELPMGSQTSVHTHPGSEFIYVTEGDIDYQNAIIGTERMQAGDVHMLPADTAVQKRNPEGETAVFLSWFIVDPDEPFAPEASFAEGTPVG